MRILLTGANGYIGLRLLPSLLEAGHEIVAVVRDRRRFPEWQFRLFLERKQLSLLEADFLSDTLPPFPQGIETAYYLLHSMGTGEQFAEREACCAVNFENWVNSPHTIYLSGLRPEGALSAHLASRDHVNQLLRAGTFQVTTLRASIIVGSGSASFEIIRDLTEKLPFMITPKWTETRCQPIAIRNVITYLTGILEKPDLWGREFDIGGPEVLTYRNLLQRYASIRGLRRTVIPVPFLSPRLSARWLWLLTAASYPLAKSLVASLVNETVCRSHDIRRHLPQHLLNYDEAISRAFVRIAQERVPSTWFNSLSSGKLRPEFFSSIRVPSHGVLKDEQMVALTTSRENAVDAVFAIGGRNGWPSMNWAWVLRGYLDRLWGGTGMRRGRRHPSELRTGDALDFWRVIFTDRDLDDLSARLILAAEMKMPGEAWLDFEITGSHLRQTATFRPKGLLGRIYWYAVLPFHLWLFPRMARRLAAGQIGS